MHALLTQLRALELTHGDWALFGSGPLLVRHWIDDVGDLDVISRGQALEWASNHGQAVSMANGATYYAFGDVTIGNTWAYGEFDIDELIDTAEDIDGFPCVLLEHVVAYKRAAGRPKDREHLEVIASRTS